MQKWPRSITAIRHVRSAYNDLNREEIPGYNEFAEQFDREYKALDLKAVMSKTFPSDGLKEMAIKLAPTLEAETSDYNTDIAKGAEEQAIITGQNLPGRINKPDVIYVSPYKRTQATLDGLQKGWPELKDVKTYEEDRIREQEHGMQAAFTDWRLYFMHNPRQALLRKKSTAYEYRHEQGESLLDVRERIRSLTSTLIREHGNGAPENVLLVTHHLAIMAMRANLERWDRERFLRENRENRPPNCSITTYESIDVKPGTEDRRLRIKHENLVLY